MRYRPLTFAFAALSALAAVPFSYGQAEPAAVAPLSTSSLNLGLVNGTFRYGVSASEVFQTGYIGTGGVTEQTSLSGNVIYSTKSVVRPFSLIYSGGVQIANGSGYGNTVFQSLGATQGFNTRNWSFNLSDVVSYLPQSPTVGLSGVPGAGDLGLVPVQSLNGPSQDILTYNSNRVSNSVSGNVARRLTARTSLSGDASYSLLHFFNNSSFDNHQISSDLSLNHTVSARTTVGVGVSYATYTFDAMSNASITTRGVNATISRQFSRSLSLSASAGPQWINSSSELGVPSRLTASANVNAIYSKHFGTFSAFYSRGTNGGSGVIPGAFSDTAGATFGRAFGRDWSVAANIGFSRTSGLGSGDVEDLAPIGISNFATFDSLYAGAQVSRRLTRSFSAFASYTGSNQSYGTLNTATPGALNGLVQSFSIGISYYPRSVNLGQL